MPWSWWEPSSPPILVVGRADRFGPPLPRGRWWHRAPFLPVPGEAYWHFRLVTAFGGSGDPAAPGPDVGVPPHGVGGPPRVVAALLWSECSSSMRPTSRWPSSLIVVPSYWSWPAGPSPWPSGMTRGVPFGQPQYRRPLDRAPGPHGADPSLGPHTAGDPSFGIAPRQRVVRVLLGTGRHHGPCDPASRASPRLVQRGGGLQARATLVKADLLLSELGWTLRVKPARPDGYLWRLRHLSDMDPLWEPYLAAAS